MMSLKTPFALALAAACVLAVPAFAAPARVTDGDLLHASRCLGLAKAKGLGTVDAAALTAFVKTQRQGRDPVIRERSDAAEETARREGSSAKDARKAALVAERDGSCNTLIDNPTGA